MFVPAANVSLRVGGVVKACACMTAAGMDLLIFNDDATHDRSRRMQQFGMSWGLLACFSHFKQETSY